jgi:hypothetical protein
MAQLLSFKQKLHLLYFFIFLIMMYSNFSTLYVLSNLDYLHEILYIKLTNYGNNRLVSLKRK